MAGEEDKRLFLQESEEKIRADFDTLGVTGVVLLPVTGGFVISGLPAVQMADFLGVPVQEKIDMPVIHLIPDADITPHSHD